MAGLTFCQTLLFYTWSDINSIKLNFQNTQQKYSFSFCFLERADVYNCPTGSAHGVDPCVLSYCRTADGEMVHPGDKTPQLGKTGALCCPWAVSALKSQGQRARRRPPSLCVCVWQSLRVPRCWIKAQVSVSAFGNISIALLFLFPVECVCK